MKMVKFLFAAIVVASFSTVGFAQWTTSGNDIYNTNLYTGKIGIGKVPTDDVQTGTYMGYPIYNYQPFVQIHAPITTQFCLSGCTNTWVPALNITTPTNSSKFLGLGFRNSTTAFINTDNQLDIYSTDVAVTGKVYLNGGGVVISNDVLGPRNTTCPSAYNLYVTKGLLADQIVIGNVTTPTGYKLYVQTGILTEKVKVAVSTTGNWSDYVFNKDYKLLSLAEVETYINKNKHLPDVPSAEEVVKNGIDMATMDAKLLQKIEELTLYMIEMKKENEKLKERVQVLESK